MAGLEAGGGKTCTFKYGGQGRITGILFERTSNDMRKFFTSF